MRKIVIGVMGPGAGATALDREYGYQLGQQIAAAGWVLLTGGRGVGVMDAASRGAQAANGLTIGVLPRDSTKGISAAVDIAIITDMGNARNNINVLSSNVIVACGMGSGTTSEIALAIKANKPVILLNHSLESQAFFQSLSSRHLFIVQTPQEAIEQIRVILTAA